MKVPVCSIACTLVLLSLATPGCTDEGEPTPTGTGGSGAEGGSGGAEGGAGGSGGAEGGAGGSGGAATACLPASSYEALFTLNAPDLCALAVHTAAGTISYQQPTWGSHGGPLLVQPGSAGQVTLSRWTPPSGPEGPMTITDADVDASIPMGTFLAGVALDLGFRPGTLVSYAGAFPDTAGELIVLDGMKSDERYPVNGLFSMALLPAAGTARLVWSGLSPLGDSTPAPNGLYAADDCAMTFDPGAGASCDASLQIAAWGDASGPIAADAQGTVFAVMTSFSGDQECRAFAASAVAKGAAATEGDVLFTLPGFGTSLAALAPAGTDPGIVAFQPSDGTTFEALDVLQIRYTVDGGTVTAAGAPTPLLTLAAANTAVAMVTDPSGRLWVGVPSGAGTTFVVLGRKPD